MPCFNRIEMPEILPLQEDNWAIRRHLVALSLTPCIYGVRQPCKTAVTFYDSLAKVQSEGFK